MKNIINFSKKVNAKIKNFFVALTWKCIEHPVIYTICAVCYILVGWQIRYFICKKYDFNFWIPGFWKNKR